MDLTIKDKNILITGGAGFIGSHLVDRVIAERAKSVTVVDNFFLGRVENLSSSGKVDGNVQIVRADASDFSSMWNIVKDAGIEVLFNLAVVPLPTSLSLPSWTVRTNYDIALSACELARNGAIGTLIHCSSSEAYGTAQYVPMDEEHPLIPCTPYAASKAAEDQLVLSYVNTFGIDAAIVRPFNNYGPRQNHREYAGIIPILVNKVLKGAPITIYGSGEQTRDYVFVDNTASAIASVYTTPQTRGEVINIGTGVETSINQIVSSVLEVMGKPEHEIQHIEDRPGDVARHCSSVQKASKLINYAAEPFNLDRVAYTVEWYTKELSCV